MMTGMRAARRAVAAMAVGSLLASCGGGGSSGDGGGSQTLYLSLGYSTTQLFLWRETSSQGSISGLEGHTPQCSVLQGRLPTGMTLQPQTCAIVGTPQTLEATSFVVRIQVPGFQGQVDTPVTMNVLGPSSNYDAMFARLPQAVAVSATPTASIAWLPMTGETLSYSVSSGSLPPGLVLDPSSGRVSGLPTTRGRYAFSITALASRGAATQSTHTDYQVDVSEPAVALAFDVTGASLAYTVGDSFTLRVAPVFSAGTSAGDYSLSYRLAEASDALPPGLTLDPATGTLSGQFTGPVPGQTPGRATPWPYALRVAVDASSHGIALALPELSVRLSLTRPAPPPQEAFAAAPVSSTASTVAWQRRYTPNTDYLSENRMSVFETFTGQSSLNGSANFNFQGSLSIFSLGFGQASAATPPVINGTDSRPQAPRLTPGFHPGAGAQEPVALAPVPLLSQGFANDCAGIGAFQVHEVAYDSAGAITRLALDFAQDCRGRGVVSSGALRHNSNTPLALDVVYAAPGRDRDVIEGDALWLDASASWSPTSPVERWTWRQVSGPALDLSACVATQRTCGSYVPQVGPAGATLVLELEVMAYNGRVGTSTLRLRIRSLTERQSLVQAFGVRRATASLTATDGRFIVPVRQGTEALYPSQRPERLELSFSGDGNIGYEPLGSLAFSISNPVTQPLVAPLNQQMPVINILSLPVEVPSYSFSFEAPGCAQPAGSAVIPVLERDSGDLTRIRRLAAWLGQSCPDGNATYARVWIDYQPVNPPQARASGPTTARRGESFTLSDAGSTAPAGNIVWSGWRQVLGPAVKTMSVAANGALQATPADNTPDGARLAFTMHVVDQLGQPAVAVWTVVVSGGAAVAADASAAARPAATKAVLVRRRP